MLHSLTNKVKKNKPTLINARTLEVNGEQHYSDGDEKRRRW